MSALSIFRDGRPPAVLVAHLISVTAPDGFRGGAEVMFTVFRQDAESLKSLVDKPQCFVLDAEPFWARLKSLSPCESPYPRVASLRSKPVLSGVFSILAEGRTRQ